MIPNTRRSAMFGGAAVISLADEGAETTLVEAMS